MYTCRIVEIALGPSNLKDTTIDHTAMDRTLAIPSKSDGVALQSWEVKPSLADLQTPSVSIHDNSFIPGPFSTKVAARKNVFLERILQTDGSSVLADSDTEEEEEEDGPVKDKKLCNVQRDCSAGNSSTGLPSGNVEMEDVKTKKSDSQDPFKCTKCKRVYRTVTSCFNHQLTCNFELSSSDEEEEEDDDDSDWKPAKKHPPVEVSNVVDGRHLTSVPQPEVINGSLLSGDDSSVFVSDVDSLNPGNESCSTDGRDYRNTEGLATSISYSSEQSTSWGPSSEGVPCVTIPYAPTIEESMQRFERFECMNPTEWGNNLLCQAAVCNPVDCLVSNSLMTSNVSVNAIDSDLNGLPAGSRDFPSNFIHPGLQGTSATEKNDSKAYLDDLFSILSQESSSNRLNPVLDMSHLVSSNQSSPAHGIGHAMYCTQPSPTVDISHMAPTNLYSLDTSNHVISSNQFNPVQEVNYVVSSDLFNPVQAVSHVMSSTNQFDLAPEVSRVISSNQFVPVQEVSHVMSSTNQFDLVPEVSHVISSNQFDPVQEVSNVVFSNQFNPVLVTSSDQFNPVQAVSHVMSSIQFNPVQEVSHVSSNQFNPVPAFSHVISSNQYDPVPKVSHVMSSNQFNPVQNISCDIRSSRSIETSGSQREFIFCNNKQQDINISHSHQNSTSSFNPANNSTAGTLKLFHDSIVTSMPPNSANVVSSAMLSSLVTANQQPTFVQANQQTTFVPANQQTTFVPANQQTTFVPANQQTTFVPANLQPTFVPANQQTTFVPAKQQTTFVPAHQQPTLVPANQQPIFIPTSQHPTLMEANEQQTLVPTNLQPASISANQQPTFVPACQQPTLTLTNQPTFVSASQQTNLVPINQQSAFLKNAKNTSHNVSQGTPGISRAPDVRSVSRDVSQSSSRVKCDSRVKNARSRTRIEPTRNPNRKTNTKVTNQAPVPSSSKICDILAERPKMVRATPPISQSPKLPTNNQGSAVLSSVNAQLNSSSNLQSMLVLPNVQALYRGSQPDTSISAGNFPFLGANVSYVGSIRIDNSNFRQPLPKHQLISAIQPLFQGACVEPPPTSSDLRLKNSASPSRSVPMSRSLSTGLSPVVISSQLGNSASRGSDGRITKSGQECMQNNAGSQSSDFARLSNRLLGNSATPVQTGNHPIQTLQPGNPSSPQFLRTLQPGNPSSSPSLWSLQPGNPSSPQFLWTLQPGNPSSSPSLRSLQPGNPSSSPSLRSLQPGNPSSSPSLRSLQPENPSSSPSLRSLQPGNPSSSPSLRSLQPGNPSSSPSLRSLQPGNPNSSPSLRTLQPGNPSSSPSLQSLLSGNPSSLQSKQSPLSEIRTGTLLGSILSNPLNMNRMPNNEQIKNPTNHQSSCTGSLPGSQSIQSCSPSGRQLFDSQLTNQTLPTGSLFGNLMMQTANHLLNPVSHGNQNLQSGSRLDSLQKQIGTLYGSQQQTIASNQTIQSDLSQSNVVLHKSSSASQLTKTNSSLSVQNIPAGSLLANLMMLAGSPNAHQQKNVIGSSSSHTGSPLISLATIVGSGSHTSNLSTTAGAMTGGQNTQTGSLLGNFMLQSGSLAENRLMKTGSMSGCTFQTLLDNLRTQTVVSLR